MAIKYLMMKDSPLQTIDLSMMENDGRTLTLGNMLLVTDNMDAHSDNDINERAISIVKRFPLKLTAACMVIVFKGKVRFSVNLRDYVATENTCLIITEGTIVENVVYDPDARVIFLSFSQSGLSGPNATSQQNLHKLYALQVVLVRLLPQHLDMMHTVYQMLRSILCDPAFAINREATAFSCLALIANIILQASEDQPELTTKTSRRDEIVARFLQCVADNYRSHRELSFYADQLCLSLKYMSHIIYEQTGRHPSQWIKDYVILDAKTMLRSGRYTVQQVAAELNFPNQSFFGKYFKEAVGISPKKWK